MSKEILVETSARHVHVTKEAFEALFGTGKELTSKKALSQPGQFACEERVDVTGPKGTIAKMSILGPFRKDVQVEVSKTDARTLGIDTAIRESGDIAGTAGCTLTGPVGSVRIEQGVIIAKRHIHATPAQAEELGICDKEIVGVKVTTADRTLIFGDVVVRVREDFEAAMHIDTDEANAAGAGSGQIGEIVKL